MERLTVQELFLAFCFLEPIREACATVNAKHIGIAGNHDQVSRNGVFNTLKPLHHYFSNVFTEPTQVQDFLFLPYSDDKEALAELVLYHKDKCRILFCHEEFSGGRMESGKSSSASVNYNQLVPKVISGHLHLAHDHENVSYVGSLIQHRFAVDNDNEIGGIYFYDTETGEEQRIPNTYSKHYIVVRDLEVLPMLKESPFEFLVQVRVHESKDEVTEICNELGLEFHYVSQLRISVGDTDRYTEVPHVDSLLMLKTWINKRRPEAVQVLEKYISI